ncbi:MAG: AAA family ATPase [Candidatus Harrisonbacteria bacterium]|nr:AAA family ATPase [Candidatus Harrisonbacteria bacterium]
MKIRSLATYKGIAIFGAPGSGKTTLAKYLLAEFPAAKYIEASTYIIKPAAAIADKLPRGENSFLRAIKKIYKKPFMARLEREEARNLFTYLKNKYSPAVIAKTLIYLHEKDFSKKFVIISGTRGYRNAVYLKNHGYLIVYLKTPARQLVSRLAKRESFSRKLAEKEKEIEQRLFSTNEVEKISHLSFNTAVTQRKEIARQIKALVKAAECKRCVNSSVNSSTVISKSGLCDVCAQYESNFSIRLFQKELKFLLSIRNTGRGKYDALVGVSGGKDSTATLYEVKRLGFTPLAFSLDTGYYPEHIFRRARRVVKKLGADYKKIDVRKYIRPADRLSFIKTADLYDEKDSPELREKFRRWYGEGRRHYSIKCRHAIPFVRTCQLCRRLIIRAYYAEALKYGARAVILGINEWAGLSQNSDSQKFIFSAIRRLKPFKNKPAVYIVHLPFLLQRKISDTGRILRKLGWRIPRGEALIESNSNSCLFARAAENKARRLLGFHPDTTRLAREVTVGFISKAQARKALAKVHDYPHSVRQVLKKAKII